MKFTEEQIKYLIEHPESDLFKRSQRIGFGVLIGIIIIVIGIYYIL